MKILVRNLLPFGLTIIAICGIVDSLPFQIPLALIWLTTILHLGVFFYTRKYFKQKNTILVDLYLIWNIICIIRGCFVAEIYWDWKNLIAAGMSMMLPLICYTLVSPRICDVLLRNLLKWSIIIFPLVLIFSPFSDRPGRYLAFFYLFMICISALSKKWVIITLVVFLISCIDIDSRSNIIRAAIALLIGGAYYYRKHIVSLCKIAQRYISFAPILFFILGVAGIFNIFRMNDYIGEETVKNDIEGEYYLTADTRTGLYDEVITSALKNNHVLWGCTPASGYETRSFAKDLLSQQQLGIRGNIRYGCEVSVLNIFLRTGIIGLILYFLIFYYSSYLAIFKSRNIYIKLIGLFVVFRWCYGWVEDFNQFDINYATLWMLIAMCYSIKFRNMSNLQFKQWINSITKL